MREPGGEGLQPAPEWRRADVVGIVVLTLVGAGLRIIGLNEGLWVDEIATLVNHVLTPVRDIIGDYGSRNNHILYSVLAHFSVEQFGASAWALRLPAALFGIATIPAAWYLGRQLASRSEAWVATAFLTFSYHHVWFSQNARGYSGLLFGSVLSTILFIRLLSPRTAGYGTIIAYAVCAALTCWLHLMGAAVMVSHGLIWLVLTLYRRGAGSTDVPLATLPALVLAGGICLLLYLPALDPVVVQFVDVPAQRAGPGTLPSLGWMAGEFWAGGLRAVPGGWPVALLAWLVAGFGVVAWLRRGLVATAILILPMVAILLIAAAVNAVVFPRFFFGSMVFMLLIGVGGGFALGRIVVPWLGRRSLTALGLAVALATSVMVPGAWQPKQDYEGAAAFVESRWQPGDVVLASNAVAEPMRQYLGLDWSELQSLSQLNDLEHNHRRIWLVYSLPRSWAGDLPGIWTKLCEDYILMHTFRGTVGGGDLVVMLNAKGGRAP
ncbi:glycosyltransferase family 39 protein [Elongatibacter sediminis]|uniref:Glycosyltransferase family 39 protein n=1 Tax=Elongatibacter sediminis TaxID=3119006 RepID=A0AAW9R6P1_9GAMM